MEYIFKELSIRELIELIDKELIDLKPSYQRNFIWTSKDQMFLIDSILAGFPLPSFFIYQRPTGILEMVDGQQRARTIYRFWKGIIHSSKNHTINDIDENLFLSYRLNWTLIKELGKNDSLETFYVLVNKRGKHLNAPELLKAEFHETRFLSLVEDLLDLQEMIDLNLFSDAVIKRMNDRSFIEELVAYLKMGISDKKTVIEKIYEIDITEDEFDHLRDNFIRIIRKINSLNSYKPINKTRYCQKNDFYTLFNFVNENINDSDELLLYQYKILLIVSPEIKPSNDECRPFRDYAFNCVTQSNSKSARLNRLDLFNKLLKNTDISKNEDLKEIVDYLEVKHKVKELELIIKEGYQLLNIDQFKV